MELSINALAAIVRAGWVVTMSDNGIKYLDSTNPETAIKPVWGDWIHIPDEVAAAMGEKAEH